MSNWEKGEDCTSEAEEYWRRHLDGEFLSKLGDAEDRDGK